MKNLKYNMTNRKVEYKEPPQTKLIVSKDEFKEALNERINIGKKILL